MHPPIHESNQLKYYGIAAHGWAGLLYATLIGCSASGRPLPMPFSTGSINCCFVQNRRNRRCTGLFQHNSIDPGTGGAMERPGMFSCGPNFFKYTGQEKYLAIAEKCANHSGQKCQQPKRQSLLRHKVAMPMQCSICTMQRNKSWLAKADHLKK